MVKYILNKQVIFLPGEKQLLSIKDGTRFTILKSSAHCLELLLERQGQLVSHSDLMVAGWGEDAKRKRYQIRLTISPLLIYATY